MTIRKASKFILVGAVSLAMAGCAVPGSGDLSQASTPSRNAPPQGFHKSDDLADLIYLGAQTLVDRAESLSKKQPIIVTTIVSVDDLHSSSTLGRLASELIANRIEQRGYLVRDVTYTHAITVAPRTGELVLSRDASKLAVATNAQAVVTGTYAIAGKMIYLSLRLVSAEKGELLSSADVAIPRNENAKALMDVETYNDPVSLDQFERERPKSRQLEASAWKIRG